MTPMTPEIIDDTIPAKIKRVAIFSISKDSNPNNLKIVGKRNIDTEVTIKICSNLFKSLNILCICVSVYGDKCYLILLFFVPGVRVFTTTAKQSNFYFFT